MIKDSRSLRKLLRIRKFFEHIADCDKDQQSLLHIAVKNNDYESVDLLLEAYEASDRSDVVNSRDATGFTPLHSAIEA